jgi:hypothetical protein
MGHANVESRKRIRINTAKVIYWNWSEGAQFQLSSQQSVKNHEEN